MAIEFSEISWIELFDLLADWVPGQPPAPAMRDLHSAIWTEIFHRLTQIIDGQLKRQFRLSSQDAEDVAQSTLVKLQNVVIWRKLRTAGSVMGYLIVMARNQALDLQRRRSLESATLHALFSNASRESLRHSSFTPEDLKLMLEGLADDDRKLLELRFWDNCGIEEIARYFSVPYSTAAGRLFRLLHRLRKNLRDST
jgi:RNA polymerase sigma factor (sigma-70 family)